MNHRQFQPYGSKWRYGRYCAAAAQRVSASQSAEAKLSAELFLQ